jgi:Mg-chelatase subunit ChlI
VADLELDPRHSHFITIVGRKGSGKSLLARAFWLSYPYDRLVIDPTGDVDPGDPDAKPLVSPMPAKWPAPELDAEGRPKRQTYRFVPDMGSPTAIDDMDRAVGLAHWHPAAS